MKSMNAMKKKAGCPKAGSSKASTKGGNLDPKLGGKPMLGAMPVAGMGGGLKKMAKGKKMKKG